MSRRQKDLALFLSIIVIFVGALIALPLISFDSPFLSPDGLVNLYYLSSYIYMIITFLTLIAISVAAIFAFGQLEEISRTRKLGVISYLLNERLNHEKTLDARDYINDAYCENPRRFGSRSEIQRDDNLKKHCRRVFYVYSEFGAFLERKLIEPDLVQDILHTNAAIMWIILKHYAWEGARIRAYDDYIKPFQTAAKLGFDLLPDRDFGYSSF